MPDRLAVSMGESASTQDTFGRLLFRLADTPGLAERLVTCSPDVSVSTNLAGWINKTGAFKFEAIKVGKDTALAQIIKLEEDAQASKAPIQKLADWVAGHFILGVHMLAIVVFVFWFFLGYQMFFDPDSSFILSPAKLGEIGVFGFSLLLSVTVLVISCPCAVGLATPSAMMAGTGKAAEHGVLFKGAEAIENASKLQTIVFDKTGTLTRGEPSVTDVLGPAWLLKLAGSAEKNSEITNQSSPSENGVESIASKCTVAPPSSTASAALPTPSIATRRSRPRRIAKVPLVKAATSPNSSRWRAKVSL